MVDITTLLAYTITLLGEGYKKVGEDGFDKEFNVINNIVNNIKEEKNGDTRLLKINIGIGIVHRLMTDNNDFKMLFDELFQFIMEQHKDTILTKTSKKNYDMIYNSVLQIGIYKVMDNLIKSS